MKTVVPTSHTRLLAARMVDAVTECTTPADVVADLLPQCRAGQEVALVALLLGHATNHNTATTNHNTATSSDNNEAETLDLNLVCLGAVAAAADMYGVTHQQVLRGTRRGTDVLARRLAMTVTHLLGGGYSEIGRWFGRDRAGVVKAAETCLADPLAGPVANQLADQIAVQVRAQLAREGACVDGVDE